MMPLACPEVVAATKSKHIYWISGTVDFEADLDRLQRLAEECGVRKPLQGPFVNRRSIIVKGQE
jgi:hypothetical protein